MAKCRINLYDICHTLELGPFRISGAEFQSWGHTGGRISLFLHTGRKMTEKKKMELSESLRCPVPYYTGLLLKVPIIRECRSCVLLPYKVGTTLSRDMSVRVGILKFSGKVRSTYLTIVKLSKKRSLLSTVVLIEFINSLTVSNHIFDCSTDVGRGYLI